MAKALSRTERNLWSAFLGEAKANRLYTTYAMKAMEEGHPEIAQVFMEAAGAETIHAMSHLKVIGEIGSTQENLQRVSQGEAYEIDTMYPRMIREAQEEGRADAVNTFQLAWEREQHHLRLFEEASKRLALKIGAPAPSPPRPVPTPEVPSRTPIAEEMVPEAAREVLTEKERIAGRARIREVIFGMQDGLISTMAVLAAVFGAVTQNHLVVIAGLSSALAGTISMAAGTYLASKAEKHVLEAEINRERREVEEHPEEEMAELIAIYRQEGLTYDQATGMAERISADRQLWANTLIEKELGLSPQLTASPVKDAVTIGAYFTLGGAVPIIPYFVLSGFPALGTSVAITCITLFIAGLVKGRITRRNPFLSGMEQLIIGIISAVLGYGLGTLLPRLVGAPVVAG